MTETRNIHRRHFLVSAAGTFGAAGLIAAGAANPAPAAGDSLPDYVNWKKLEALIQHSDKTFETRRGEIGLSVITPNEIVFVRNNLPSMTADEVGHPDQWQLEVDGVATPGTLSVADLKRLDIATVCTVLQCSGNGRAFFAHQPRGSQWSVGAAANVLWTGVPLRAVADALGGPASGMNYITGSGGEKVPEGIDPLTVMVERSVPIDVLDRAILAWEMNGEALPLAHGAPLRLIVPGYYGVNNVKHLKRLAFTADQSSAKIQQTGYRVRDVGEKGAAEQPSMYEMNVKSWVTHPLRDTASGKILIWGVALGGTEALEKVEVSTDGGKTWQAARFVGPDLGVYAWRPFLLAADLPSGSYRIASRATTVSGAAQPAEFPDNERGYGHNGWQAHAVDVTVM